MPASRKILAGLIAISIALVPATAAAAISVKPVEMSMASQAETLCCAPDDCKGSIACAFKCFNFVVGTFPTALQLSQTVDAPHPFLADGALRGHLSPPTHPPPI